MPGSVIPGFGRKAMQIANAGIYDLRIHHDDVIMPLLRHWQVFALAEATPCARYHGLLRPSTNHHHGRTT